MARIKTKKDIDALYKLDELKKSKGTPYGLSVSLRGRRNGGYISKLNRQQKKTGSQLKGLPGCGPNLKEWLLGY